MGEREFIYSNSKEIVAYECTSHPSPFRFVVISFQMCLTRLIWGL